MVKYVISGLFDPEESVKINSFHNLRGEHHAPILWRKRRLSAMKIFFRASSFEFHQREKGM